MALSPKGRQSGRANLQAAAQNNGFAPGSNGFAPLDKNSFEPLYFQIQSRLEQQIRAGKLAVDDPLPGEAELSRIFGVSRMTARQALQSLTTDGFAYRERGRGTFVRAQKVEKHIAHLLGFSAEMRLLGLRASTEVLAKETVAATPQIAALLHLEPSAEVTMLHRLRFAEDEPIAIEQVWIPHGRFPGIGAIDFGRHSLYETLRKRYHVEIDSANETIEARGATREEAQLLRIALRSSLLVISRTLLDGEGRPIETARSLYRGDRYSAVLHIPATSSLASGERNVGRKTSRRRTD